MNRCQVIVHKRFVRLDGPVIETITSELGIEGSEVCRLSHPVGFAKLRNGPYR